MLKRTEIEVTQEFRALASPYFRLLPEVWMKHLDGSRLRMDFLARPQDPSLFPVTPPLIGFEVKRDHDEFKTLSKALKQAVDYRHSAIDDRRIPKLCGITPLFVFVYPPYEDEENMWAGAVRLAGRYNVGVAAASTLWNGAEALELRVADGRLWDSERGPRADFETFCSNRGRGSR
jgi:hypothetical protein